MSRFALRGFDGSGAFELPDFTAATCSFEFSDIGALDLDYEVSGLNASRLADNVEIALLLDGVELDNGRWLVRGIGGDEAVEGTATYKFSGRSILSVFEGAVVLGATPATPTPVSFVSKTAGEIIRTLITQAQARGALTGITMGTFSNTLDSNSSAWATTYTVTYNVGVKYIDILRELVSKGLIELKMVGADLRVYKPDTMGTDTTNGATPVTLRTGIDFKDAPFTRSVDNYASDAIVEGDNATYVRRQRTSTHPYGRQEVFISQSGTADSGALTIVGDSALDSYNRARIEKTRSMVITSATQFHPLVDFKVSDYIFQVAGAPTAVVSPEKVRVRMISVGLDTSGIDTASLVLNDKFMDQEIIAARQIDALMGGAISTSTGGPATSTDTTVPAQPAAPAVSSAVYTLNDGTPSAVVTVTANTPALNVDGSAFSDLASYAVRWRYADANVPPNPGAWQNVQGSSTTTIAFSAVRVGVTIEVQTACFDQAGHISAWSASTTHTTATDSTPPPVPSTPVAVEYIGSVKVTWDGQFAGAAPKPTDFRHVEVHLSVTSTFTPDDTTMVGILQGAGSLNVPALSYGVTYYAKLRSVDSYGNKSAATSADSAIPFQATTGDIAPSVLADVSSDPVFVQYFGSSDGTSGWVQADQSAWDLLKKTASDAEDGTTGGWIGIGGVAPTITNSSVRAYAGTKSFRATWGTTSGYTAAGLAYGWKVANAFVPGKSYTATARVYVPTGSPNVAITIPGGAGTGATVTTKDAWAIATMTWTATDNSQGLQLSAVGATTAGQYVDFDDVHIYCNDDLVSWYNDTGAPTVPGVLRIQGRCLAEWQASSPMPYDPKALYRVHGRIRINHTNKWTNGDFAAGQGTWSTFWSGGSLTWAFSNSAKATYTAGGAAQTAVLAQGVNSSAPSGTTIRVAGRYRCTDAGANPRVEPVFAPAGGDAQYFGSGSIIASALDLDPSVGATWTNFSVDVQVPSGYTLYTMYLRCNNLTAAGGYIEWDDVSQKELSTTTEIGFVGYKADRTTPIQPNNATTNKDSIHSILTIDGSQVDDNGWVEFTGYLSDRSTATGSRAGLDYNTRTFEYGTHSWEVAGTSTAVVATSAADGSAYGLRVTCGAVGTTWAQHLLPVPIINDGITTFTVASRVRPSVTLVCKAFVSWSDADGVYISTSWGPDTTIGGGSWGDVSLSNVVPPADAATAKSGVAFVSTATSQYMDIDDFNFIGPFANGATAQTAAAMAAQASYWRPAIFFDPRSIADDILDVDWFQVDRVQADLSIPGSIVAPQVSTGQLTVDTAFIDQSLVYNTPNAADGYVLTAQGPNGDADWEILPTPVTVSDTAPASPRTGQLWLPPSKQFHPFVVTMRAASAATQTTTTINTWTECAWDTLIIDVPTNGLLVWHYNLYTRMVVAATIVGARVHVKTATGCTATNPDEGPNFNIIRRQMPTAEAGANWTGSGFGQAVITGVDEAVGGTVELSFMYYSSNATNLLAYPTLLARFDPFMDQSHQALVMGTP